MWLPPRRKSNDSVTRDCTAVYGVPRSKVIGGQRHISRASSLARAAGISGTKAAQYSRRFTSAVVQRSSFPAAAPIRRALLTVAADAADANPANTYHKYC